MAQVKVTEYFRARKRPGNLQASKRRKVQRLQEFDLASAAFVEPISKESEVSCSQNAQRDTECVAANEKSIVDQTKASVSEDGDPVERCRTKTAKTRAPATRKSTRTRKAKSKEIGSDMTIREAFSKVHKNTLQSEKSEDKITKGGLGETQKVSESEEVTAILDDHQVSPPSTPTKRQSSSESETSDTVCERKRRRDVKTTKKDHLAELEAATPQQGFDFSKFTDKDRSSASARKRLVLKADKISSRTNEKIDPPPVELSSTSTPKPTMRLKDCKTPKTLTPETQPQTPVTQTQTPVTQIQTPGTQSKTSGTHAQSLTPLTDKVRSVLKKGVPPVIEKNEQVKQSKEIVGNKKLTASEMRSKLAKCGKLAELQARLAQVSESAAKLKDSKAKSAELKPDVESEAVESEPESVPQKETKAPAYERFHSLAQPVPPTLSLPYKYKVLLEMFRSMDTVVSMLHNRSEICTFNKLKAAVQEMVRKNFELRHVGQIKTVHPTAYEYRQEKGLPQFGSKTSGYQLTIEPRFEPKDRERESKPANNVKGAMAAGTLLSRRNCFHSNLIQIVKEHHKEFLANLPSPIKIPDKKITRWHPAFKLDQVPDIEPSQLPEPPVVKKFSSAADVLDQARGKVHPRMERVLENISKTSVLKQEPNEVKPKMKSESEPTAPSSGQSANMKGVPQSLLERIRAKEARKLEADMTRDPEADKRIKMLERLPELVRILRMFYVTEKKTALPMTDAVKKLADSYKSGIALGDVEAHINLMVETLPKWLTIVTVKRGQFIKIDKNQDINAIMNSLDKRIKESKGV